MFTHRFIRCCGLLLAIFCRLPLHGAVKANDLLSSVIARDRGKGASEHRSDLDERLPPAPGLVPAIHALLAEASQERRGCPRQAGHDGGGVNSITS
jgi:hypothetical protein